MAESIALHTNHVCAVLINNGSLRCWGNNAHGQLGDGTMFDRLLPPLTDDLTNIAAAATSDAHTCALLRGIGTVQCWGENSDGELGDGSNTSRSSPSAPILWGAVAIATGGFYSCAIDGAGQLQCWGQLTNGATLLPQVIDVCP